MKYGELITKDYPIIVSKTNPIDPTVAQVDEFFNEIEAYLNTTTGPYVFVTYTEESKFISSDARIHIGKKSEEVTAKFKTRNKGSIIVANGIMATMMLKAISVVYKPLKDTIIVKTLDEAFEKAKEILK